ncbi:MAG: phage terminase large subunit family protein [Verrucomicrobiota bacterium]
MKRWKSLQMLFDLDRVYRGWAPPPDLKVSEWAAEFRRLSPEGSAEVGRWRNERTPYVVEIMDCVNDPTIERIVLKTSAQIGKTEFANNVVGYYAHQDPCSMLMVQPTESMAKSWVGERANPMFRDCPCFEGMLTEDNLMHKAFPGGFLAVGYAKSAASLASRPIRVLLLDEVDRYDLKVKDEGDPVNQAITRTKTFHNKKIIAVSTPKLKGSSRIDALYSETDQRIYLVLCPKCGDHSPLKWEDIKFDPGSPKDSAVWVCPKCTKEIEHRHKREMLRAGRWEAQQPFNGFAGFHINELYSPWVTWGEVAASYLSAKRTDETLQTWHNLSMGESYEPKTERVDSSTLSGLKEGYTSRLLPKGVLWLVAGVDTQADRFEVDVWGYGLGEELWHIETEIILGDPKNKSTQDSLDKYLLNKWPVDGYGDLELGAAFVDSGGNRTKSVYDYVRGKAGRKIFAIKGASSEDPFDRNVEVLKQGYSKKYRCSLVIVHVSKLKYQIYSQFKKAISVCNNDSLDSGGAGYVHFSSASDSEFFQSLSSEKLSRKTVNGRHRYFWEKEYERNERLDNVVYARAAFMQFKPDLKKIEQMREERVNKVVNSPEKKKKTATRSKRKNWATSF